MPALSQWSEAVALLMRECAFPGLPLLAPRAPTHARPVCPAAQTLRTRADLHLGLPVGSPGRWAPSRAQACPFAPGPWHVWQPPRLLVLNVPTPRCLNQQETRSSGGVSVETGLCPGAECSEGPGGRPPAWEPAGSTCRAGGAGRGVTPSLAPVLLGRRPSHPNRRQWPVTRGLPAPPGCRGRC